MGGLRDRWQKWRHEPHFLARTRLAGAGAWVAMLVAVRPHDAWSILAALALLTVIVLLPASPRVTVPAGLAVALACGFVPGGGALAFVAVALFAVFLTAGYACDGRIAAALAVGYAMAETACAVWLGGWGARSGAIEVLRMLVGGMTADGRAVTAADVPAVMLWAFGAALSAMLGGFAALFGHAFRRSAVAGERLARSEAMVGRLTREQRLAHMIHDSVANDMSVIAMLAWRARIGVQAGGVTLAAGGENGHGGTVGVDAGTGTATADLADVLDAIYARSHHALDRVHEVIDILDGKRALDDEDDADDEANGSGEDSRPADLTVELERYLEDQDRVMAMIGMPGVSRIVTDGTPCEPSAPVRRAVLGLVEELYANVVRHAAWPDAVAGGTVRGGNVRDGGHDGRSDDAAQTYSLFVTVERGRIRIAEVNAIGDGTSAAVRGTRHGRGLEQQRATIASVGGTLNAAAQDGSWTVAASIPVA